MRLAESKEDGHMHAIKIIDKKALRGKEDSLENEIRVLKRYDADSCFFESTRILVVWHLLRTLTLLSSDSFFPLRAQGLVMSRICQIRLILGTSRLYHNGVRASIWLAGSPT